MVKKVLLEVKMNAKCNKLITLVISVVYITALVVGLLNNKNNVLFLVLPCASFIWTILDAVFFAEKMLAFAEQLVSDLGNVLFYQLPDFLAILLFKFDQPISITTKMFVGVLVIVNLIVVYLIDRKHYKNP